MKTLLQPFLTAYACRLAAGFIWRANRSLWERITAILSPETSGKFTIVSEQAGKGQVTKIVNRTQLEKKFGGLRADKNTFWPPEDVGRAVYTAETAAVLSDYSSFQEYFPERSLSLGDTSHISFSDEDSPRQVTSFVISSWPSEERSETEEGPTVTKLVRVNRLSVDLARSPKLPPTRRRPIISLDNVDTDGIGCYCFARKTTNTDCETF